MKKYIYLISLALLTACYSNNCPVDNKVFCNYYFYDSEGTAISYGDAITVSAILPGGKTVYVYRRLGEVTVTSDTVRPDLIKAGYAERVEAQRNDTILINKASGKQMLPIEMSYFNSVDTLLLRYGSISMCDTIYIEHESYPHVDIPECGSFRFHHIKSVRATDAAIDHIEISNPTVNYDGAENIKIYFNGVAQNQ